ncbi:MAG TPA: family 43 glycosylhydrolase [bacterium]|nr:family 43 glycosylhydrolase [bacterium]
MKTLRMTVKLIATIAAVSGAPLLAQTTALAKAADGIMLGSWNTQVEFDDANVVCGKNVVLNDSFDAQVSSWVPEGGVWLVTNGVLRQTSSATPALTRFAFKNPATNYTVSVRAKKLGGAEGFLVGFGARDSENYYWLNLGGWNNTAAALEKSLDGERSPVGTRVGEVIETGRWYALKIEVTGQRIQCFVDGRRIIDLTDAGFGKGDSAVLPPDNDKLNFGRALIPDMVADPSIVDIDGTFYCYATTDGWGQGLATSGTPVVWQSKDFRNWSFEGSSFPADFDLKYWAPSTVVHKNGRYYSFPTLDGKITAVVADSPLGPFVAPDGRHVTKATLRPFPIEQKSTIDAEVFIDDDGQAYMVWSRRRMVKLKPDLLSPDGPLINLSTKREGYSEGPFLTKRNGIYYYFYTLGGNEAYQYAYMMSRSSPLGPWEAPEQDIIATTDHAEKVFGPGHGCFFHPQGSDQWYFVYLEYGRGGTTRQIYADKMNFNPDGTIQPVKLTKTGVGALRPTANSAPNLALDARATASSVRPNSRVRPRSDRSLDRVETFAPANALDDFNSTRWLAVAGDSNAWFQVDLGVPRDIRRTEAYFVKPAAGHAYRLEWSLDGAIWQPYGGHEDVILRSPHRDEKTVRARYLKLTILEGEPGLWEFRIYGESGQLTK